MEKGIFDHLGLLTINFCTSGCPLVVNPWASHCNWEFSHCNWEFLCNSWLRGWSCDAFTFLPLPWGAHREGKDTPLYFEWKLGPLLLWSHSRYRTGTFLHRLSQTHVRSLHLPCSSQNPPAYAACLKRRL